MTNDTEDRDVAGSGGRSLHLRRNEGIDLLRGGAIIFVVLNHVGMRFPIAGTVLSMVLPRWLLDGLLTNGYEAVFVFFVISGFLIAGNALRRWGGLGQIDVAAFYARRFARIVPCLLALVAILSVLHLSALDDYTISGEGQSLGGAVWAALALHVNWYEGRTGSQTWWPSSPCISKRQHPSLFP